MDDKERFSGIWGDIGIVKGTLSAMSIVVEKNCEGYCALITGQDYPLRSNNAIRDFLEKHQGSNFISVFQNPDNWKGAYKERITKYKVNKSIKRGHFLLLSSIFDRNFYERQTLGRINYLIKNDKISALRKIFKRRSFPDYIEPYGGGVYFALPMQTVKKIISFHKRHPEFLEFNEYTLCADEVFFHSIIMHLHKEKKLKISRSLTYVNWERPTGPLPVTFGIDDLKELKQASEKYLWARKFDESVDSKILDEIDKDFLDKNSA